MAAAANLYFWEVRSAAAPAGVLHHGTTFGSPQVTLPILEPGSYLFLLRIVDGDSDCSQWHVFPFDVLDPQLAETIHFDRVLSAQPIPPDLVRYLPRWLKLYGPDGADSTTFQLLRPFLQGLDEAARQRERTIERGTLPTVDPGEPRLAWQLSTRLRARDVVSVRVKLFTTPEEVREVRRAISEHDFLAAQDPVFLLGGDGQLAFRNLSFREATLAPVTLGSTPNIYVLPGESGGVLPDAPLFFQYDPGDGARWYQVPAGSVGTSTRHQFTLPAPYSGHTLPWRWQSRTYAPTLEVSVNEAPYVRPAPVDLWNRFDEIGLLCGIRRRPGESNVHLRRRLQSRLFAPPGSTVGAVSRQLAQSLDLTELVRWDGRSTLDLDALQIYGSRRVDVLGLPEIGFQVEQLVPLSPGRFSAAKSEWLPGALLTLDGLPVSTLQYPGLQIAGNEIDFGTEVEGDVWARYRYRNWTPTADAEGSITQLVPMLANTPPAPAGGYDVILSRRVELYTADSESFLRERLLNADGTPSGTFRDLRLRLVENSPVHLGRAAWGRGAHWFAADEEEAQVAYMPAVFDLDGAD